MKWTSERGDGEGEEGEIRGRRRERRERQKRYKNERYFKKIAGFSESFSVYKPAFMAITL